MANREGYRRWRPAWRPSEAERRVLDALTLGLTNSEIAAGLSLSADTVKWHISQLLAKTGLDGRDALAAWWKTSRDERPAALPLHMYAFLISSPVVPIVVIGLAALIAVVFAYSAQTGAPADAPGQHSGIERAEAIRAHIAALPSPTPNPRRQAWVVDTQAGEARPVPFYPPGAFSVLGFARWLEDGQLLFGTWAGEAGLGEAGLIHMAGQALLALPVPQAGYAAAAIVEPLKETQGLAIWRAGSAAIEILDVRTGGRVTLLPQSTEGQMVELRASPTGAHLAVVVEQPEGVRVEAVEVATGERQVFFAPRVGVSTACCLSWSPDERHLMLVVGAGRRVNGPPFELHTRLVVDQRGRVVWEEPLPDQLRARLVVRWAGPGRLFESVDIEDDSGGWNTIGRYVDIDSGDRGAEVSLPGRPDCFSPSGRYAILRTARSLTESKVLLWDVEESLSLLNLELDSMAVGHCDWTTDEGLVVLSSGGS
jgi:DNA-binding CsgD family transcriptional regulator